MILAHPSKCLNRFNIVYINGAVKQVDGRRVSKQNCPINPTIQQIEQHLKILCPESEIFLEEGKRYPRGACEQHDIGRVKVTKGSLSKHNLLKQLAQSIQKDQQQKQNKGK